MASMIIIDNSVLFQEYLKDIFWTTYDIHAVTKWQDAAEIMQNNVPDVIILSNILEGLSGFEICNSIKDNEHQKNVKILMMSSLSGERDIARAFTSGVDAYLIKPSTPEIIKEKVSEILDPNYVRPVLKKHRILCVDDSPLIRNMLEKDLKEAGYEVETAIDGQDGFEKVREFKPDLITTDLEMPNMDGYEFAKALRHNPQFNDIPVIMITSHFENESRSKGFLAGVTEYFVKPVETKVLINCISKIVETIEEKKTKNIILVEDSPTTQHYIKYFLQKHGWNVKAFYDGNGIIEELGKGQYDLVVLDLLLPDSGPDGIEVLRQIKLNKDFQEIPVMMISTDSDEAYINMSYELGAEDYMVKPFSINELIYRAKIHMRDHKRLKKLMDAEKNKISQVIPDIILKIISEDLRPQVASIIGTIDMLMEDATKEQKDYYENIKAACKKQTESITRIIRKSNS